MAFSKSTTSLPPVQQCTNHRDLSFSKHPLWPYKERKYICSESTDCSLHTFNLRKCQTPLIQLQCFSFNGIYIYKLFLKVHLGITRILSVFLFWSAHWLTDWLTDWLSLLINCPNWDGLTLQGTDSTSTDGSTCIVFWLSKNFVSSPPRCRYALIILSVSSLYLPIHFILYVRAYMLPELPSFYPRGWKNTLLVGEQQKKTNLAEKKIFEPTRFFFWSQFSGGRVSDTKIFIYIYIKFASLVGESGSS